MLDEGTLIELRLPGHEAPVQATVLSCSSTMVSVRLQEVGSEVVHRVSLKKLPFTVLSRPGEQQPREHGASDAAPHQPAPADPVQLDAFSSGRAAAVEAFVAAASTDPAAFLQPTAELAALARAAAKAVYDHQAALGAERGAGAPPQLHVDGFDAEQVWLQLELAVGPALKRARKLLRRAGPAPQLLTAETEQAIDDLLGEHTSSSDASRGTDSGEPSGSQGAGAGGGADGAAPSDLAGLDYDALLAAGAAQRRQRQPQPASDSEQDAQQNAVGAKRRRPGAGADARAAVEDEHFNLDEMEAFVQQAEREAAGLEDAAEGEVASEDEEAELEALLDQASGQQGKKGKKANTTQGTAMGASKFAGEDDGDDVGATAMFEDFFGPRSGVHGRPHVVMVGGRTSPDASLGDGDESSGDEEEPGFKDDMLSDDMLSGDEEEGVLGRHRTASEGEPGVSESDDEQDRAAGLGSRGRHDFLAESDEDDADDDIGLAPSAHELRQRRMQEKIWRLEEAAMGDKDWFMEGEVDAARRPKNSALELDLDFETTVKPPPQPTEEMTRTLDELIRARVAEGRFDDVVRITAAPVETKRTTLELDDRKPQQGLGELYEQEYVHAVTGVADDKDEEVRQAARAQFSALCAKLDALSHLHFTPRPVIEEVAVRVDVPAIAMEEAAPQFVSGASMRAPEEVFASEAAGAPQAEDELSREDRKRRRAQRKRAGKKRRASKEEELAARAATASGNVAGRKSEAAEQAARKADKGGPRKKAGGSSKRSEFTRSAAVFAKIEQQRQHRDPDAVPGAAAATTSQAASLKL